MRAVAKVSPSGRRLREPQMISSLQFKPLNRRSVWLSAGCALLLAASLLALRLARGAGEQPPSAEGSSLTANVASGESESLNSQDGGGGRIRTDRKVYPEPPLPRLPRAGGKFNDPVFGTLVMRATDEEECPAPGCGTYYSHWTTFNADNTYLLIRRGESGNALVKPFDPVSFSVGKGHQPAGIYVPGVGQTSVNFESAMWHPTDPQLIYCFSMSYDNGMRLYAYNVVTRKYTLVKDFSSLGGPRDFLHQMSMSSDGDVFAWSQQREGAGGDPIAYLVWRKSTGKVLYHTPTPNRQVNEVRLDKSGQYLTIAHNDLDPTKPNRLKGGFLNLATGKMDVTRWNPEDSPAGHGDVGTGISVGADHWASGLNKRRLDRVHEQRLIFRFQDEKGAVDWTEDFHGSLLADDESWITIGTYDDPAITLPDTSVFENEILQIALDGSGRLRRLLHTRTGIDNKSTLTGYSAMPKPTISRDGRFIAYTSNWEKSGRYDLFIARIEPAPHLPGAFTMAGSPASAPDGPPSRAVRPRRVNRRFAGN
jgi:hypothetical protein